MKTLFTLLMPILVVITAMASHKLFMKADYYASALLFITSFLATSLWITVLSSKRLVLR